MFSALRLLARLEHCLQCTLLDYAQVQYLDRLFDYFQLGPKIRGVLNGQRSDVRMWRDLDMLIDIPFEPFCKSGAHLPFVHITISKLLN